MSDPERLHRADPERTEPIRDWTNLYRRFDSWNERASSHGSEPGPDGPAAGGRQDDWATQGVKLAYQVIDDFIRKGQSAARQMGEANYGGAWSGGNRLQDAAARMMRCSAEIVPLWFEFVNAMISAALPSVPQSPSGARAGGQSAQAAGEAGLTSVSVEVSSVRPARVSLKMHAGPGDGSLTVSALRAMDAQKPAITDIEFAPAAGGAGTALRVRIPEAQPADTYTGVIVDRNTGEARGTLTVRVIE